MDDGFVLMVLYFWIALSFAVAILANRYHRTSIVWFFGCLLFSPAVGCTWLLAMGPKPSKDTAPI